MSKARLKQLRETQRVQPSQPTNPEPQPEREVPTLEQCENVALTLGFGSMLMLRSLPHYEESLRNLHALVQRVADGDEQSAAVLARMREAVS